MTVFLKRWLFAVGLAAILVAAGFTSDHAAAAGDPFPQLTAAVNVGRLDRTVFDSLQRGGSADAVLGVDDSAIIRNFESIKASQRIDRDTPQILAQKAAAFSNLKSSTIQRAAGQAVVLKDYRGFAAQYVHVTADGAAALLQQQGVVLRENVRFSASLAESLPLINQPAAVSAGLTGAGTSVAVIDTYIDITNAALGSCTAVNTPAGTCKVTALWPGAIGGGDVSSQSHGTNVAAIVVGVAPGTRIVGADVFDGNGASSTDILNAIDWVIANQATYNIVAVNMSLGVPQDYNTSQCTGSWAASAFTNLRTAGVLPVVAAGNSAVLSGSFQNGIASPACTPGAISVGAVYDSNVGGRSWGGSPTSCSDPTTAADKITCFSQSASYLSVLAPGAIITAGGIPMAGTSQATPHVAGAIAVLAAGAPSSTLAQREAAVTGSGPSMLDSRNGVSKHRLDVCAAVAALGAACGGAGGPVKATITSPAPSSTLPGANVTFVRDNGAGVSSYLIWVGSSPGTYDLGAAWYDWFTPSTGAVFWNLPTDGRTLYVRLWSVASNGSYLYNDYTFKAATATTVKAQVTSPIPGSTLPGASVSFVRDSGQNVSRYLIWVGSSPGTYDIDAAWYDWFTPNTAAPFSNMPTDGRTVYVRLWSVASDGSYLYNDYTFKAATATTVKAQITSPSPGSTLPGASVSFVRDSGQNVSRYLIWVGSSPGTYDIDAAWYDWFTPNTAAPFSNMPTDGRTVYVRLWSVTADGTYLYNDYTFKAATATTVKGTITSPAQGSTLPGASVSFVRDSGQNVSRYLIWVGSSPGTYDIDAAWYDWFTPNTAAPFSNMPTDGRTVYVRLWSVTADGTYLYNDYTYHAATVPVVKAQIPSPSTGSTLTDITAT